MASRVEVEHALADVLDPEYPVSLVDLGLVRGVEVEERLLRLEGIDRVEVVESFDPWTRKDVSRRGLALLRRAGVA